VLCADDIVLMTDRILQWLQIFGSVGVLGGLILVALQMQQNTEITRAQLAHDAWLASSSMEHAKLGEEPALIQSKILTKQGELSDEDIVAIDGYFTALQGQIFRIEYTNAIGLDIYSSELAARSFSPAFVDGYGRAWWDLYREDMHFFAPTISQEIEKLIETGEVRSHTTRFREFSAALKEVARDGT
jgi:hypothetical protein